MLCEYIWALCGCLLYQSALPVLQQNKHHLSHSLGYKNGYAIQKRPEVGIGGRPIEYNQLNQADLDHLANFNPTLTYGQAKQAPPEDFIPAHVAWDKKVQFETEKSFITWRCAWWFGLVL